MSYKQKYNSVACCIIGVLLSLIIGVIIGILFYLGYIPNITTAVWIAFGLAAFSLIILIAAAFLAVYTNSKYLSRCLKHNIICLIAGIWGTLISALAALSIVLNTNYVSVAILVGISAFFTSLSLIALMIFVLCVIDNLSGDRIYFTSKE